MLNKVPPPFAASAGASSISSGTLQFSNASGVSFGLNGSTLTASVKTDYLTTGRASSDAVGLNTAQTNVTWTVNSSGISLNAGGYAGTGFTSTTTAGTDVKATNNTAGLSMAVPSMLTTARGSTDAIGLNTAKTNVTWTANSSGLSFDAGGYAGTGFTSTTTAGVDVKGTLNTAGLSLAVPAVLTTARGSTDAVGLNTAQTNVTWTVNSSGISFNAVGYAGTGFTSTTTAGTAIVGTNNTAGMSVGVPAFITTADLSANSSKYVQNWKLTGNTAGTTSSAQGTDFWISGGNSITVSGSSNSIVLSVGAYITTADLSQNSSKYGINWKLTGNTAGTTSSAQGTDWWFAGGNSITVSGSSNTISFSVGNYITTADLSANSSKYVQNWKLTGNTAGTTSSAQGTDLWLAGGNGITVSGSSNTISFSVGAYLTTARASTDAIGLNTAKTNVTWTVNSSGLSLDAGGYAGTGFTSTTTAGTDIKATNNTSGLSLAFPAWLTTADLSANSSNYFRNWKLTGNTAGTTSSAQGADFWLQGGNNITVSGSSNTIIISAPNLGAGAMSAGVSTGGNTAGATGITGTQLVFVGSGVISLSQTTGANGGTLSILAPATSSLSATGIVSISTNGSTISIGVPSTVSVYASSNTFGTSSGTANVQAMSIAGSGAVSVAASNSGWVVYGQTMSTAQLWQNFAFPGVNSASSTFGLSTGFFMPIEPQNTVQWNQLGLIASASLPTTSHGNTVSFSFGTSGQSQQVDFFYSFTGSNLYDFYLLSRGTGGYSTDLVTMSSTRNSIVTFLNETYRFNGTAGAASQTFSASNSVSLGVSFPAITSATSTSVNAASTFTLWGPGYSSWASTASGSTTTSKTTGATISVSVASTYPATTAWASNKLIQFNWLGGSIPPGQYWLGILRGSTSSSSFTSSTTSVGAGRSFTSAINFTDFTMTAMLTLQGQTNSLANSLGTLGGNTAASMAPSPGHGTYSATYAGTKTLMNNNGQANGEIALSDIGTATSFFRPWVQFNSNRI